jgi:hypothetical protein
VLLHVVAADLLQVELGLERGDGHSEARVNFRGLAGQFVGGFGDVEYPVKVNERNHSRGWEDRKRRAERRVMEIADSEETRKVIDSEEVTPVRLVQAAMVQKSA